MSPQPPAPNQPPPPNQPPAGQPGGQPWPGPPSTWPAAPGGAPPTGGPGGAPEGPPPPPWQRRRRRWTVGALVVGAVLVIGVPLGLAAAALTSAAQDIDLTSPSGGGSSPPDGTEPRAEVEVVVPDLDGLDGTDAEIGQVLVDVNRSEEQMIATQERFADVLADAAGGAPPDDLDGLLDEIGAVAGDGQRELQDIRRDLTGAPASDGGVRALRDVYLDHLDSWVRYFVAVEADPTLFASGADEAFMLSINTTGDAFARVVREDLPDGLDAEVRAFADQIVDRGFPDRALSNDDTV